jgi:predicted metal-dependent phosphoesterase TrpH
MSEARTLRGIIHCHSRASTDSLIPVRSYLRAAKKLQLDFVILTDHDSIAGSSELHQLAASTMPQLQVPIAAEYHTERGDVIAAFLRSELAFRESANLIQEAREQGAMLLLPHPYVAHKDMDFLAEHCDLIEVFNSRSPTTANLNAVELATKYSKPVYASSDAHLSRSIGAVVLEVEARGTLRESLLEGRITWEGRSTARWETATSQMIKAARTKDLALARIQIAGALRRARKAFSS